jgi:hypothetical protein
MLDSEALGDLPVLEALGDEFQRLLLALGQLQTRMPAHRNALRP